MNKRILVTGGTGFTGGHLCRTLIDRGYTVRALVRKNSKCDALQTLGAELVFGDLRDRGSLDRAVEGVDVVYHIAAVYREQNVSRKHFFEVNVEGTRNMLDAAYRAEVERFVHCSTVGVQGEIKNPPADETAPYNPGDPYQESKTEGEMLVIKFLEETHFPCVIFRPVGIYGPGDTRFLKLFRYIYNGKFKMIGNGQVLYHLTYIDDLIDGIILCGEKDEAVGEIYTLGGNEYLTLNELVALIAEVLEVAVPQKRIPLWPVWLAGLLCEIACAPFRIQPPIYRRRVDFFIKDRAFDISKAKRELGYNPKVSLKQGLKMTADWYKANGYL